MECWFNFPNKAKIPFRVDASEIPVERQVTVTRISHWYNGSTVKPINVIANLIFIYPAFTWIRFGEMFRRTYLLEIEQVVEHKWVLLNLKGAQILRGLQGGQRVVGLLSTWEERLSWFKWGSQWHVWLSDSRSWRKSQLTPILIQTFWLIQCLSSHKIGLALSPGVYGSGKN